eukprot:5319393-Amphidinium_carterae.1
MHWDLNGWEMWFTLTYVSKQAFKKPGFAVASDAAGPAQNSSMRHARATSFIPTLHALHARDTSLALSHLNACETRLGLRMPHRWCWGHQ